MRRILSLIGALAVLLGLVAVAAPATAAPPTSPDVISLYAGNVLVATANVSNDASQLTVKYSAAPGWELAETHLAVTAVGRVVLHQPARGRFVDSRVHRPLVTEDTYTMLIPDGWKYPRTDMEIVAQAMVHEIGDESLPPGERACGEPMSSGLRRAVAAIVYARDVSVAEACTWIKSGDPNLVIIDVRAESAYNTAHISGAISKPFSTVAAFKASVSQLDPGKTYLVYCGTGKNGGLAAAAMRDIGFAHVYNLAGGYTAWAAAGGCSNP
jgi:rhodanese-related sulfurtransferase